MYIIVAYDIQIERIGGVYKYLKRYLNWIQNSLLEEVTKSELEEIKNNLTKLIEMEKDHIVIYELRSNDLFIKESIGKAKLDTSNII